MGEAGEEDGDSNSTPLVLILLILLQRDRAPGIRLSPVRDWKKQKQNNGEKKSLANQNRTAFKKLLANQNKTALKKSLANQNQRAKKKFNINSANRGWTLEGETTADTTTVTT